MSKRVAIVAGAGSAAFLFAGLGPRVMLAPDDGGGSGGGDAGSGDGGSGAGGDAPPVDAGKSGGDAAGGEPSLLGQALAPKDGTGADGDAPPGGKDDGKKQTGDKELGDKAEPKKDEAEAKADDAPKDIDGNPLPDAYEFQMPDGFTADQELLDMATPLFKEHRLSPSQAQAVVDMYAKVTKDSVTKHMDTVKGWKKEAREDKAFNEDGGWDKNLALAHEGFRAFGNEELLQLLDTYGLGEHRAVLRAFRDIGKAVGETGTIGGDAAQGQRSTADILYPSMAKK